MYDGGQTMFTGTSHSYSSSLNPMATPDRSRVALGSPQVAGHAVGGGGYSFSPNTAPNAPANYGVGTGQSLNESLAQSRPQYQPGYLLSLAQSQSAQTTGQRYEETHLIPTRAKMNPTFPRNASSDFGSESMFESTSKHRHREAADDEDGPPTSSVADIVNEVYTDSYKMKPHIFPTPSHPMSVQKNSVTSSSPTSHQMLYIIVFGYPPTRYSSTVAHFQSTSDGGTTEPELSLDVENAFKIGYKQPWEAARAWRRHGETISGEGGRWMVGVKWADPLAAEQVLGSGARIFSNSSPTPVLESSSFSPSGYMDSPDPTLSPPQHLVTTRHDSAPAIGTPIRVAPSASAFKKLGPELSGKGAPLQSQTESKDFHTKGMFGHVSDLIFGW